MIDLSNNENVLGASPQARQAMLEELERSHHYPPRQDGALLQSLAELHGVDASQVLVGNGAQHVLRVIAATFLEPRSTAVALDPTYTGYRAATATMRAEYRALPAKAGGYDVGDWVEAARGARLLWLCSPNNPTGCTLLHSDAEHIAQALPADSVLVFDATYSDFVEDGEAADGFALLANDPRTIVVKTFSKLHGLAGLRLGYALAHPHTIAALTERIDTFPANRLAIAAGRAALADRNHQEETRRLVSAGRRQLLEGLRGLGLNPYASQANFVTVPVGIDRRDAVVRAVREAGYLIRPLDGPWRLPDCVRLGIGRPQHNAEVLAAIAASMS